MHKIYCLSILCHVFSISPSAPNVPHFCVLNIELYLTVYGISGAYFSPDFFPFLYRLSHRH